MSTTLKQAQQHALDRIAYVVEKDLPADQARNWATVYGILVDKEMQIAQGVPHNAPAADQRS